MKEINIPFKKYHTHAYVYGDLTLKNNVVIVLHGGPGGMAKSLKPLYDIANYGYTVVTYDQLGSDKSGNISGKKELFKVETFVDELDNLVKYFKLKNFTILGHSWGGMLALEYLRQIKNNTVKKLILFSSLSSAKVWNESNRELSLKLISNAIVKQRFVKAYDDLDDKKLNYIFEKYLKSFYRVKTNSSPHEWKRFRFGRSDEIYNYMWGKVDLFGTGTLRNWDVTPSLKSINIPTLILYGGHDQSTKEVNNLMHKNIKSSKVVFLPNSGHCGYYNDYKKALSTIIKFLK